MCGRLSYTIIGSLHIKQRTRSWGTPAESTTGISSCSFPAHFSLNRFHAIYLRLNPFHLSWFIDIGQNKARQTKNKIRKTPSKERKKQVLSSSTFLFT